MERVKNEQAKAKALGIELQIEREKLEHTLEAQTMLMYIQKQNCESSDSSPETFGN